MPSARLTPRSSFLPPSALFPPSGDGAISAAVTVGRAGILPLAAEQDGRPLPITIEYDRNIWSGLSWAVGEIRTAAFDPGRPVTVRFESDDASGPMLECRLYLVRYE